MADRPIPRRDFLTGTMSAVAAVALGGAGARLLDHRGSSLLKPIAARPVLDSADYSAIEHVVFLMHENRSFDHYFGVLEGVNGFFSGSPALDQAWSGAPAGETTLGPFHLDTTTGIAECTNDLSHSWQAEHSSWNNGAMDSFVSTHTSDAYEGPDYGTLTMGYYTNADLPFYYALAQAYTICDNYFCSVLGPTHPNRLMQMTGTIDPAGVAGGPILVTNSSNALIGSCSWTTMPEVLSDAGVSWKVYNPAGSNYTPSGSLAMLLCKNPLFYMDQYQDPTSSLYQNAFGNTGITIPTSGKVFNGLTTTGAPSNFVEDVKSNTLPQVSWIIPPDGYDEHPPAPAALGEWYTAQVIKTLQSNKDVWESTVLFIMYDENDGWFDHVAPPTALTGPLGTATPGEFVTASSTNPVNSAPPSDTSYASGQPIGLGVRVPMIVVSPFSAGGWVCSDVFDHTSQLQFLATIFGVDGTVGGNVSSWRQGTVGDLTATLTNFPLPTTGKGSKTKTVYPKNPKLPVTSDKDTNAPLDSPDQCTANDLDELGGATSVDVSGCSTTDGSNTVSGPWGGGFTPGFSDVLVGFTVSGAGIPNGTLVTGVSKGSGKKHPPTVTLSNPATASGTASLTFVQPVPVYPIPDPQVPPTEVSSALQPVA